MNRKELAEALLDTPIFQKTHPSQPPEIYAVSERDGFDFWVKEVRYNEDKDRIELVVVP